MRSGESCLKQFYTAAQCVEHQTEYLEKLHEQWFFRMSDSLRKQPSFVAPGRVAFWAKDETSRQTPLVPGAKKDSCVRRLYERVRRRENGTSRSPLKLLCTTVRMPHVSAKIDNLKSVHRSRAHWHHKNKHEVWIANGINEKDTSYEFLFRFIITLAYSTVMLALIGLTAHTPLN